MNYIDLKNAVKYVQKECPCHKCQVRQKQDDISILGATKFEAVFEINCHKCKANSVISVVVENDQEISTISMEGAPPKFNKISKNDILDIKNFLTHFDGNFKRIFKK